MKISLPALALVVALLLASCDKQEIRKTDHQLVVKTDSLYTIIEIFRPSVVRITHSLQEPEKLKKSLIVKPEPGNTKWDWGKKGDSLYVITGQLKVCMDLESSSLEFMDTLNREILATPSDEPIKFGKAKEQEENTWSITQRFRLDPGEGIYGLGHYQNGTMNYRNHDVLMVQSNTMAANPFLVSTKGYGILWDNYSKTWFQDGKEGTSFWSETGDAIDYYFIAGSSIDEAIAGYRYLTGEVPLFAKSCYGYWQSRERYKTQEEVLKVAQRYRQQNLPIDNIVQDWQYWGGNEYFSGMRWDSDRYPDPTDLTQKLDSIYHLDLMNSIWPAFGSKSAIYREMDRKGHLFKPPHWSGGRVYDPFSEEARNIYWQHMKSGLWDKGVDYWWMDGTEPEFRSTDDRYITGAAIKKAGKTAMGSFDRYLNAYSYMTTKGVYRNQREISDEKRVFILTRSAFAGQQAHAATTWTGDIGASWKTFRDQISAGLNFCMAGIPYWTNDIGAFFVNDKYPEGVNDPAYQELYVRWFQYGAFLPIFRSHGTDTPREIYQFGEPGDRNYEVLKKYDKLRYRLLPYIYSQAWQVTKNDYTLMRGLPMDFPEDEKTHKIGDEYMFGPSLLVSPITKPMYHKADNLHELIPYDAFQLPGQNKPGIEMDFYKGTEMEEKAIGRKTEQVKLGWFGSIPLELQDTSYSVKWQSKLEIRTDGIYEFMIQTNGGVKLTINNTTLIDEWDNGEDAIFKGEINLKAGKRYDFRIVHNQPRNNQARFHLKWLPPGKKGIYDKEEEVYLPAGTSWYDFWTGKQFEGGQIIQRTAPINIMPLYVKAGSILPMGPNIQYAEEKPPNPLEIRVYTGAAGSFVLYEDENDGYGYEKGEYTEIPIKWDENAGELNIGKRRGSYPGMLKKRTFKIVWVDTEKGTGGAIETNPDRIVEYSGDPLTVKK